MSWNTNVALVLAIFAAAQSQAGQFRPGEVWLDTAGKPIQAHGGGILVQGNTYYWYGEDKTLGNGNKTGISCYSSTNLYDWKHEGVVLPKSAMPEEFRDHGIVERPKVIANPRTGKYVMWMHLDDGGYHVASAGIALSDKPTGPFVYCSKLRPIQYDPGYSENDANHQKQLGGTYRDMNLFVDDDGQAYAFYSSESNATMYIVRLNSDFTGPQMPAVQGKTWERVFIGQSREAPAPFKFKGRYYLISSACTGWAPNPANYAVADNILGPWEVKPNPCIGPEASTTFRGQSTFVLPVAGKPGCFIFMADRWLQNNLADSRYIWLPLVIQPDGTFTLEWRDSWNLSFFDKK